MNNSGKLNAKIFLKTVKENCKKYNVNLKLEKKTKIKICDGVYGGGYFQEFSRKKAMLVCAMNHENSLQLLAHEYSHMLQWIDNSEEWKLGDSVSFLDEWLQGKNVRNIEKKIDNCKLMELDCEKRAVKLIKKFKLPIDIKEYIKRANSYILFYNYIKKTRKWSDPKNSPYSNKKVWSKCPSKFMPFSYYEKMPKKIEKVFIENNI